MDSKYIRVATTLYKLVQRPLHGGDTIEIRVPWNMETLRQDHTRDFISKIEKFDGFCCVPDHINHQRVISTFLNDYEAIEIRPQDGGWKHIQSFLRHIFSEQYPLGLDYIQLLYTKPLQRLPILLLVSKERNTGKTTFLNLLKAIFGGNMTFNTNEDFRSQFNSDWASKLIVAVDEVLLDRNEDSERIKNLSTARSYKAEAKGKDRSEVEFFAKFVLCSNNTINPIHIEQGETRYWVRKVPVIMADNPNLLNDLKTEIPAFLWFLQHRELSTKSESRMWFRHDLLITDALRQMINHNRNKFESEMFQIISEILELQKVEEYLFCIVDMAYMLDLRGFKTDHAAIRRVIQHNWMLAPSEPRYYVSLRILHDGAIGSTPRTGRCYSMTKIRLAEIMLVC